MLEVAVGATENALTVYEAADASQRWRFDMPTYGYARPTVADFRDAPGTEVVASDIEGNVVAADANGSILWRFSIEGALRNRASVYEAPIIDDMTGSGRSDVLVGASSDPVVFDADGNVQWHRNGSARYITAASVDDGGPMTVFTSGSDGIRTYDGTTGEPGWMRDLSTARIGEVASVDGRQLLYIGVYGGDVVALDAETGETVWTTEVVTGEERVPPPVTADVDGDDALEVVAVANNGTIAVLNAASEPELAAYERSVPIWTSATTADLDGDGSTEIMVIYGDGRVVMLEYTS